VLAARPTEIIRPLEDLLQRADRLRDRPERVKSADADVGNPEAKRVRRRVAQPDLLGDVPPERTLRDAERSAAVVSQAEFVDQMRAEGVHLGDGHVVVALREALAAQHRNRGSKYVLVRERNAVKGAVLRR